MHYYPTPHSTSWGGPVPPALLQVDQGDVDLIFAFVLRGWAPKALFRPWPLGVKFKKVITIQDTWGRIKLEACQAYQYFEGIEMTNMHNRKGERYRGCKYIIKIHYGDNMLYILLGGLNPSEKYEFVSWDDDIPNIYIYMGK